MSCAHSDILANKAITFERERLVTLQGFSRGVVHKCWDHF
jgi:hypothetical protein